MSSKLVFVLSCLALVTGQSYYDAFTGKSITDSVYKERVAANQTFWCVNQVQACNKTEWRRLDGTCNNLKNPQRGASHTPEYRYLPAVFAEDGGPRLTTTSEELPNARHARREIWPDEGYVQDNQFTTLSNYFLFYTATDSASQHDTTNYLNWRNCCPKDVFNENDAYCVPHFVPDDDPEYDIHCMNLTRPLSFQTEGCTTKNKFDRLVTELPLIDLSSLYGNNEAITTSRRTLSGGQIKVNLTTFGGIHVMRIWLGRNHNNIATKLAALNPCWGDDTLFYTAREINLAQYLQMLYYEYFPSLFGRDILINDGVISKDSGFRDIYNASLIPQLNTEYMASMRWFHNMQQSFVTLMDSNGTTIGSLDLVDKLFAVGWVAVNNTLEGITHAAHRQHAAAIDYQVDPEIANYGLGLRYQDATDITANDLAKSRYYGFAPYVDYLSFCHGGTYDDFDTLCHFMEEEQIKTLRKVYENVADIDFAAGLWSEKPMKGGYVPATLYCLMSKHLLHNIQSDRHWYERSNRPHAFTKAQLAEIRKSTMANFMCTNGDNVSQMQPNPFYVISKTNALVSCSKYHTIDLSLWVDKKCSA